MASRRIPLLLLVALLLAYTAAATAATTTTSAPLAANATATSASNASTSVDAFLAKAGFPSWQELGLPPIGEVMKLAGGPQAFQVTVAKALATADATLVQALSKQLPPSLQWIAKKAPAVALTLVTKRLNTTSSSGLRLLPQLSQSGGNLDRLLQSLKIPGLNATAVTSALSKKGFNGATLVKALVNNGNIATSAPAAALKNLLLGGAASSGGAPLGEVLTEKAATAGLQLLLFTALLANGVLVVAQVAGR